MPRCKFLKEKKKWVAEIHNIPPNKFNIYNMTDVQKKKYNSTQIKQELVSVSVSVRINNDKKKPKQVAAFLTYQTNRIIQLIIIDNCVRYHL